MFSRPLLPLSPPLVPRADVSTHTTSSPPSRSLSLALSLRLSSLRLLLSVTLRSHSRRSSESPHQGDDITRRDARAGGTRTWTNLLNDVCNIAATPLLRVAVATSSFSLSRSLLCPIFPCSALPSAVVAPVGVHPLHSPLSPSRDHSVARVCVSHVVHLRLSRRRRRHVVEATTAPIDDVAAGRPCRTIGVDTGRWGRRRCFDVDWRLEWIDFVPLRAWPLRPSSAPTDGRPRCALAW